MYLSQLRVNMGSDPDKPCPGREWIKQTYRVHQRLWMAFPDANRVVDDPFFLGRWKHNENIGAKRSEGGFLFRIEPDRPVRILVQSALKPDWDYAFQNAPYLLDGPPQEREFSPVFSTGMTYRFRLVMLMVRRATNRNDSGERQKGAGSRKEHQIRCLLPDDGSGTRKRDPHHTAWRERLCQAGAVHGFKVDADLSRLRVSPHTTLRMKPLGRGQPDSFNAALFDGSLTCTDSSLLQSAVANGIGRGKAFGMGLMSLAVVE
jgi:CRISPR system Cascade subunit CasE